MRRQRNLLGPQGMGGMVSLWGASSLIRSVQTGTISLVAATNAAATITAVNTANSFVLFQGCTISTDNGLPGNTARVNVTLTNATTVNAFRQVGTDTATVAYTVLEFATGIVKSLQSGEITVSGVTSNTATITVVNTDKAWLFFRGFWTDDGNVGEYSGRSSSKIVLTNSTTITASKSVASNSSLPSYTVVEFF